MSGTLTLPPTNIAFVAGYLESSRDPLSGAMLVGGRVLGALDEGI